MEKKLLNEIKRIHEISNYNKKIINEGLLDDIKHFFEIASPEILDTDIVKKLKNYFKNLIPGIGDAFSEVVGNTSDTDKPFQLDVISSDDDVYKKILTDIGAPITDENMLFMYAWRQSEHTEAKNNPFGTTQGGFGATPFGKNKAGVKEYPTTQNGIDATVTTLKNGFYNCIVDGLKNNIGAKKISQKCDSDLKTWGTHVINDLITDVLSGWEKNGVQKPPTINK
jgi:hypothetical protein